MVFIFLYLDTMTWCAGKHSRRKGHTQWTDDYTLKSSQRNNVYLICMKICSEPHKSCASPEIMAPGSQDHSVCWKTFLFHNEGNITIFFPIHQSADVLWQNVNMVNLTNSCVRTKRMAVTHLGGMMILIAYREKENNCYKGHI